jgi:hypothetical protein
MGSQTLSATLPLRGLGMATFVLIVLRKGVVTNVEKKLKFNMKICAKNLNLRDVNY